jgi:predicted MFS family arabinose efflux permease
MFAIGTLPALLVLWIRRNVEEPEEWRPSRPESAAAIFRPPLLSRTVAASLVCASVLFAYWGLFTWIPAYLASPVSKGGAGLSIVKTSAWIIPVQIGALLGYSLFGVLADRFGRRSIRRCCC